MVTVIIHTIAVAKLEKKQVRKWSIKMRIWINVVFTRIRLCWLSGRYKFPPIFDIWILWNGIWGSKQALLGVKQKNKAICFVLSEKRIIFAKIFKRYKNETLLTRYIIHFFIETLLTRYIIHFFIWIYRLGESSESWFSLSCSGCCHWFFRHL